MSGYLPAGGGGAMPSPKLGRISGLGYYGDLGKMRKQNGANPRHKVTDVVENK